MATFDERTKEVFNRLMLEIQVPAETVTIPQRDLAFSLGTLARTLRAEHELKLLRRSLASLPAEINYESLQEDYGERPPV